MQTDVCFVPKADIPQPDATLLIGRVQQSVVVQFNGLVAFAGRYLQRPDIEQFYVATRAADHPRLHACAEGSFRTADRLDERIVLNYPCLYRSLRRSRCRSSYPR